MAKKRYYYDSKGRSRGYSSDVSPQKRNFYALLIALPLLVMVSLCSDGSDSGEASDASQSIPKELSQQNDASEIVAADQENAGEYRPDNPVDPNAPIVADEPAASGNRSTEEYLRQNYVNGNSSCPIDMYEYQQAQCSQGDESACTSVRACNPDFDQQ